MCGARDGGHGHEGAFAQDVRAQTPLDRPAMTSCIWWPTRAGKSSTVCAPMRPICCAPIGRRGAWSKSVAGCCCVIGTAAGAAGGQSCPVAQLRAQGRPEGAAELPPARSAMRGASASAGTVGNAQPYRAAEGIRAQISRSTSASTVLRAPSWAEVPRSSELSGSYLGRALELSR
jgi:hypothetical protein